MFEDIKIENIGEGITSFSANTSDGIFIALAQREKNGQVTLSYQISASDPDEVGVWMGAVKMSLLIKNPDIEIVSWSGKIV